MSYTEKSIVELHELLKSGEITPAELLAESLEKIHALQDRCNAFVTIIDDAKPEEVTDSLLSGIPYGVKDLYSTKDILTTGSSNTLRDYVPFFSATAVENLDKAGAVKAAKTVTDEFGMGGTGTTGHTGVVRNPWDLTRMCAGSSAGSACAVAAGVVPFALGTDTGDSVRKPAAYCGIVGFKPTYGMISRYGVFPFASSIDHCGAFARNVADVALVVDAMKGKDDKDMTSWDSSDIHLYDDLKPQLAGMKLCYVKELCDISRYPNPSRELQEHLANFMEKVEMLRANGAIVEEVSVDQALLNAQPSVYVILSCAEATSNLANLTGLIFGPRGEGSTYIDVMKDHRTHGFSSLIKRRLVIGSYVPQKENQERYFKNAQRVRRLLVDRWKELYQTYDAVNLPVGTGPAKHLDGSLDILDEGTSPLEEHMQIGNVGGFPSITIPDGFIDGLPVALNITGNNYEDQKVLNIAAAIEGLMDYKNQIAREVKR